MLALKVIFFTCVCFVSPGMNARNGTDIDAAYAMKTFSSLGYNVKVENDRTVAQMKELLSRGNRNYKILYIQNLESVCQTTSVAK